MDHEPATAHFRQDIPGSVIQKILLVLPVTVVNLELDLEGAEEIPSDAHHTSKTTCNGVCDAIAQLLPRLHTLALGLAHICEDTVAPFTDLVSGTENSEKSGETSHQATIYPLRHAVIFPHNNSAGFRSEFTDGLAKQISPFYNPRRFPHLQSFVFIELKDSQPGASWHKYIIQDVINNTTKFDILRGKDLHSAMIRRPWLQGLHLPLPYPAPIHLALDLAHPARAHPTPAHPAPAHPAPAHPAPAHPAPAHPIPTHLNYLYPA
ncbi:uncharacterized protein BDZ99DRAFT_519672 [Mytilinidion resinicola]|uniref:Uncharacterized protein n=1 Tax=Mytilinidion resinicola TaxID=574789 RepID=A0A6A6YSS0_9PEZI|nr:uncharacterized protein BDZ99DRAFT_519672 [Mytilinidion resinicola]KAF2811005.1 hypothetical protein BDZ99DRAFT_519672 [Mytilinidion resinicola]